MHRINYEQTFALTVLINYHYIQDQSVLPFFDCFFFLDACMHLVGPDDNIHYFVCPIAACTSALNPSSSILR